jgi:DNA polymerase-3 subunit delta
VFYILHGEQEFNRSEEVAGLRARLADGDQAMAQLNTTILDGKHLTLGELCHACDSIPFMSDRRLVIVHGLLSWLVPGKRGKGTRTRKSKEPAWRQALLDELAAYLPSLPPTTRLVFVEERTIQASHAILKVAQEEGKKGRAFVKQFKQPKERDLPNWIQQRARDKGGEIGWEVTRLMATLVGNDLRLLDQEIDKLLIYADGRQVTEQDVRALVSRAREASVFDLVDCVGRREAGQALRLLHRLLDEGEPPLRLMAMLARQVRILIQVKELQSQRLTQAQMAKQLKLHPFGVKKGLAQAGNFTMEQLEKAHRLLVETDWMIKTGEMEDVLALDMLVVALTRI